MMKNKKGLCLLLGISFVTQATTSLLGGLIGVGPFTETGDTAATMKSIADNISGVYIGIILQIITSLVIVVLAAALYQSGKHINKTTAIIAFGLYLMEVAVHIVTQLIVFALVEVSQQFAVSGNSTLITIGGLLGATRTFCGNIAMIPFGLGAVLFYYLIMKADVIPKWLGYWGIITVSVILLCAPLTAFGLSVPFVLLVPYVPWEWVAGVYIFIIGLKELPSKTIS